MLTKDFKYPDTKAHEFVITRLKERGVDLHQLAKIAFDLQQQFIPKLTEADCYEELLNVMHKRELLNNAMVALELDRLAEENQIKEPLLSIIRKDAGVFGVDEALHCRSLISMARLAQRTSAIWTESNTASSKALIPMKTISIRLLTIYWARSWPQSAARLPINMPSMMDRSVIGLLTILDSILAAGGRRFH